MTLSRRQLRKLIKESINESKYQRVAASLASIYDGPWRSPHDFKYVTNGTIRSHLRQTGMSADDYLAGVEEIGHDYQITKVREALSDMLTASSSDSRGGDTEMYQLFNQPSGAPLPSHQLFALIQASADPNSSYKLSRDRLGMVNQSNLSAEEQSIIDAAK